jgi:hypothetical protein
MLLDFWPIVANCFCCNCFPHPIDFSQPCRHKTYAMTDAHVHAWAQLLLRWTWLALWTLIEVNFHFFCRIGTAWICRCATLGDIQTIFLKQISPFFLYKYLAGNLTSTASHSDSRWRNSQIVFSAVTRSLNCKPRSA